MYINILNLKILKSICLIIDHETKKIDPNYKNFKCGNLENWYETFSLFSWNISNPFPTIKDFDSFNR